jgi:hypothetical protein
VGQRQLLLPLGSNHIPTQTINGMTQVGNQVWVSLGANPTGDAIGVFDTNGNYLYGLIPSHDTFGSIVSVGNQVWTQAGQGLVNRYDTSGNLLGTIVTFPLDAITMSAAEDAVWLAINSGLGVGAYDLSGDPINVSSANLYNWGFTQAIVEVPEPGSLSFLFLGIAVLIAINRRLKVKFKH